jgi:hypothetical protein
MIEDYNNVLLEAENRRKEQLESTEALDNPEATNPVEAHHIVVTRLSLKQALLVIEAKSVEEALLEAEHFAFDIDFTDLRESDSSFEIYPVASEDYILDYTNNPN